MSRKFITLLVSFATLVGFITFVLGLMRRNQSAYVVSTSNAQRQETSISLTPTLRVDISPQQEYVSRLSHRLADLQIPIVGIDILEEKPLSMAVKIQSAGPSSGPDRGSFDDVYAQEVVYREALLIALASNIQMDSLKISAVGNDRKPLVVLSGGQEIEDYSISYFYEGTYRQLVTNVPPSKIEDAEIAAEVTKLIDSAIASGSASYIIKREINVTQNGITQVGRFVDVRYQVINYTSLNWVLPDEIEQTLDKLNADRGASIQLYRFRIESEDGVPICQYVKDYLLGDGYEISRATVTEDMEWPSFSSPPAGAKLSFRKSAYPSRPLLSPIASP